MSHTQQDLLDTAIEISLGIDWWDESVGVFDPEVLLRRVSQTFPGTVFDPIDYQEQRLLREMAPWQAQVANPSQQAVLIRQSKGNYRTNGPSFKFMIPFDGGWEVQGIARRLIFQLTLPKGLPQTYYERLQSFMRSLRMGAPAYTEEAAQDAP